MKTTPKSLRVHLGIFGRTNVGKSSFLNLIAGQDVSITSQQPGTTTDVVEKVMELLPIGPVVFLDTAGLDDQSILGEKRIERTRKSVDRTDIALIILEPNVWTNVEENLVHLLKNKNKTFLFVVNKVDQHKVEDAFIQKLSSWTKHIVYTSSIDITSRDRVVKEIKKCLVHMVDDEFVKQPSLLEGLIDKNKIIVMVVPIDLEAPKGRLIMPQVQMIRDALDHDAMALVVKENGYLQALKNLNQKPALVICDSQAVKQVVAETPKDVLCTTFSILMMSFKVGSASLKALIDGALVINQLQDGDKILIAESCSHHAVEDDIGRVKLPRWLREYTKKEIDIEHISGRDYPKDLKKYKLVIHCGGCMLNKAEMCSRMQQADQADVAITNYGLAISLTQGVLKDVLKPFGQ